MQTGSECGVWFRKKDLSSMAGRALETDGQGTVREEERLDRVYEPKAFGSKWDQRSQINWVVRRRYVSTDGE